MKQMQTKQTAMLEHVQKTFPWANAVCLNRKSATSPPMAAHRDKGNKSASMICFWGDYDNSDGQGALCLEDGTMQLTEHKTENSGLWQGALVRRTAGLHRQIGLRAARPAQGGRTRRRKGASRRRSDTPRSSGAHQSEKGTLRIVD